MSLKMTPFPGQAVNPTRFGDPAWKKTANRIIQYWSGMTDTELNGPYTREV